MYYYNPLLHTELGIAISAAALSAAVVALIAIFLHLVAIKRRKLLLYKHQTASNVQENEVHATEDDQPLTRTVRTYPCSQLVFTNQPLLCCI